MHNCLQDTGMAEWARLQKGNLCVLGPAASVTVLVHAHDTVLLRHSQADCVDTLRRHNPPDYCH